MSTFRFRLDKVLAWYREQCQMEENRVAACVAAVSAVKTVIVKLQTERLRVEREIVSQRAIAASDLAAWGVYRLRVRTQELDLQQDLERQEKALREQRARLLAARRRVQLLEKLRERRLAEHTYQVERELERLGSELYLSSWIRQQAERRVTEDKHGE